MTINESFMLAYSGIAGIMLGLIFFGGLWWTIHRMLSSSQPAIWVLGSLLLRSGLILTGFYWVSNGHWLRLGVCLCGFVIARLMVIRMLDSYTLQRNITTKKVSHAS